LTRIGFGRIPTSVHLSMVLTETELASASRFVESKPSGFFVALAVFL
jgi:hypothetical protein